jgi:hypothetical protein
MRQGGADVARCRVPLAPCRQARDQTVYCAALCLATSARQPRLFLSAGARLAEEERLYRDFEQLTPHPKPRPFVRTFDSSTHTSGGVPSGTP